MQEFLLRVCGPDIRCVKEDFAARFEHQSQSSLSVVVSFHVILCFVDCRLCFFDCHPHPFCEFIDCF